MKLNWKSNWKLILIVLSTIIIITIIITIIILVIINNNSSTVPPPSQICSINKILTVNKQMCTPTMFQTFYGTPCTEGATRNDMRCINGTFYGSQCGTIGATSKGYGCNVATTI